MYNRIIFFDGYCILCNRFADFIIRKDKKNLFKLASLQSQSFLALKEKIPFQLPDSILVKDADQYFIKSTAALRVFNLLPMPWKLFYIFILIPRPIRDYFYDKIASKRMKMFGRRAKCRVPTPDEFGKLLD